MTNEVVRRLSAPDGLLSQQNKVLAEHTNKMERMFNMLTTLTGNMETVTKGALDVPTGHTKTARTNANATDANTTITPLRKCGDLMNYAPPGKNNVEHPDTPMHTPERPARSPRGRETSTDGTNSDGCSSPDRQRMKHNPGVSAAGGNETRAE
jgi:uncharacterized coiled-coil protein SlyX